MLIYCVRFSFSPLHSILDVCRMPYAECPKLIIAYAICFFPFIFSFSLAIEFIVQNIKFNIVSFMMFQLRDTSLFSLDHGVCVCAYVGTIMISLFLLPHQFWLRLFVYGEIGRQTKKQRITLFYWMDKVLCLSSSKALSFLCSQIRCDPKRNEHILWLFLDKYVNILVIFFLLWFLLWFKSAKCFAFVELNFFWIDQPPPSFNIQLTKWMFLFQQKANHHHQKSPPLVYPPFSKYAKYQNKT